MKKDDREEITETEYHDSRLVWHCTETDPNQCCSARCSSREFFSLMSKKHILGILRTVMIHKVLRFGLIVKEVQGSSKTITKHIGALCKAGILHREAYNEIPPRVEYSLTEKGGDLIPILEQVREWNEKWEQQDLT